MIPLVGGSALGCARAAASPPQYHLSYSAFCNNESHLKGHWGAQDIPWHILDKEGEAGRGADAVQNAWMLKSAQYVLSRVRPKVLWGENAPALYQGAEELVDKLVEIGREQGYSFSMVKTDSQLHGLPQRRVRTFYFFWQSPTVPMLAYKLRPGRPPGRAPSPPP